MLNILDNTKEIAENSTLVSYSIESMRHIAEKITEEDLKANDNAMWQHETWSVEDQMSIITIFNAMNYCFWAEKGAEKWHVTLNDETLDGSTALFRCIEDYFFSNKGDLHPSFLKEISSMIFSYIVPGSSKIPLLTERIQCLQELGSVLESKFESSFSVFFKACSHDAVQMTSLLVDEFPYFNDAAAIQNKTIPFYKRAQLNAKMISDLLVHKGNEPLRNLNKLTAFADYKVPQILRRLGILAYAPELAEKIDTYQIIEKDSREEIEIRANTIWAIEEFKEILKPKFSFVTAAHVDHMLWSFSQIKHQDEKPYHRTYTIAY